MSTSFSILSRKKQDLIINGYSRSNLKYYFIINIVQIIKSYILSTFYWDNITLLKELKLSNNSLTVQHNGRDYMNYIVICNTIFETGLNSFDIKITNMFNDYDIFIGVVPYN